MAATKNQPISDPVLPDQGGRIMPIDPLGVNASREEAVREKAYHNYIRRGGEGGTALQDWVKAERELRHKWSADTLICAAVAQKLRQLVDVMPP